MRKSIAVLSFLLSLGLVLILLALQISLFTRVEMLNHNFYDAQFKKNNLSIAVETAIKKDLSNLGSYNYIPSQVFNGLYSAKWVDNAISDSNKNFIDFMTYKTNTLKDIDTSSIEAKLSSNVDNYVNANKILISGSTQSELNTVKTQTVNIIKNQASVVSLKSLSTSTTFLKLRTYIHLVYTSIYLLLCIMFILIIVLYLVNIKVRGSFIRWLAYALIAAGLFTIIPGLIALISGFMKNIAVSPDVLKNLAVSLANEFFKFFIMCGGICIAVAIIFLALLRGNHE